MGGRICVLPFLFVRFAGVQASHRIAVSLARLIAAQTKYFQCSPQQPTRLRYLASSRGRLVILAAAILWSLAGVFIKFLDLHPLAIVFYRSLFASLVFMPFSEAA